MQSRSHILKIQLSDTEFANIIDHKSSLYLTLAIALRNVFSLCMAQTAAGNVLVFCSLELKQAVEMTEFWLSYVQAVCSSCVVVFQ